MMEYSLILRAVAIIVLATYELMCQDIRTLVNKINNAQWSTR
jgi:Flp pilus assembly pilin Flp